MTGLPTSVRPEEGLSEAKPVQSDAAGGVEGARLEGPRPSPARLIPARPVNLPFTGALLHWRFADKDG